LLLRDPNFVTAQAVASAIDAAVPGAGARVVDSREVDIPWPADRAAIPEFMARIEAIAVPVTPPARVVVDERTGTIVIGNEVQLGPVSILHGNLSIQISTTYAVSQAYPEAQGGKTVVVPKTTVKANDGAAAKITLAPGATVQDLVNGLQAIGANARDIVSILRAIKAAGALEAQLVVI
jgi:flagellar P-ring protein precursor FlgI